MASTQYMFAQGFERSTNTHGSSLPYKMADRFPEPFLKPNFASGSAGLAKNLQQLEQSVQHIRSCICSLETQFKASQERKQQEHTTLHRFLVQQNNEIQWGKNALKSLEASAKGSQQPVVEQLTKIEGRVEHVESVLRSHRAKFDDLTKVLNYSTPKRATDRDQLTQTEEAIICNSNDASGQGVLSKKLPRTRVTKAKPNMRKMLRSQKVCS